MDIKPPNNNLPASPADVATPTSTRPLPGGLPRDWLPGQLLLAVVMAKSDIGPLLLNIQGILAEVTRPANLPLQVGQRLELKLLAKEPLPLLQVQTLHNAKTTLAPPDIRTVNQALRKVVPRQTQATPLLANLRWLATQIPPSPMLPRDIQQLSQQIYQQLPTLSQLRQPAKLAEQLQRSGPFLEANLAKAVQHRTPPATEIRIQLLRLATLLRTQESSLAVTSKTPPSAPAVRASESTAPTTTLPSQSVSQPASQSGAPYTPVAQSIPASTAQQSSVRQVPQPQISSNASLPNLPSEASASAELLRQVEGVLARVQVQQLQSLHAENQGRQLWAMELPIKTHQGIDLFDFRIERDAQQQADDEARTPWSVTLAFDLAGLGAIRTVISLRGETISTQFWAEQRDTSRLFNQHLDNLRNQFDQVGLNVGKLECRCGTPLAVDAAQEPKLLDEKA